jgi:hypothetical protein
LKHASTTLRVQNALDFESPLCHKGFGPDILPDIADSALVALGISEGDVLHLKNGSHRWWNGPDAKRKHDDIGEDNFFTNWAGKTGNNAITSDKHVGKRCHYKYCFPDGGRTQYNGPPMTKGDWGPHNKHTRYWDEGRHKMVPIPSGFTAPPHDAPDEED